MMATCGRGYGRSRLSAVGGRLAVVAEELDAIGPLRHLHREMDVAALGPAIDLAAAGEHAVVAEVERRILDDDALVPIILDRVREIDQDMARPLPAPIAGTPAAFGCREFGSIRRAGCRDIGCTDVLIPGVAV